MKSRKVRLPLFYLSLALTLLHPQFFTPGVLTILPPLEWLPPILDALNWLPAFLGMAVLALCFPWEADGRSRLFRTLLLMGAACNLAGYLVFAAAGNSVYLWQIALNSCCFVGPTAILLALRDWLKTQPREPGWDKPDNARTSTEVLLAFVIPGLLCYLSLFLTRMFPVMDPVTYAATPWAVVLRIGVFLGGVVYWFRPLAVLILLVTLLRPLRTAAALPKGEQPFR